VICIVCVAFALQAEKTWFAWAAMAAPLLLIPYVSYLLRVGRRAIIDREEGEGKLPELGL
jgi:hypothetical protein